MRLQFSKQFQKTMVKLPRHIQDKFDERFSLFSQDTFHPLLHNHSVHPIFEQGRSINITGDYRAIYTKVGGDICISSVSLPKLSKNILHFFSSHTSLIGNGKYLL